MQASILGIGHQHRVVDRGDVHAIARQNLGVVFHVLADFQDGRILKHRFQRGNHLIQRQLPLGQIRAAKQVIRLTGFVGERDIAGFPCLDGQRDADQIDQHFV